ncbi:MAG: flagellar biosynthetic protein FliO [Pseudomonadales bacterium]
MAAPEAFDWLRYALSVALVLGLLALTLWGLRRSAASGNAMLGQGDKMVVLDRLRLSPRQQLLRIRALDEEILLAVSPQEIRRVGGRPLSVGAEEEGASDA